MTKAARKDTHARTRNVQTLDLEIEAISGVGVAGSLQFQLRLHVGQRLMVRAETKLCVANGPLGFRPASGLQGDCEQWVDRVRRPPTLTISHSLILSLYV